MNKKSFEVCFEHKLRSADRVLTQYYNECLAPEGIRATQLSVLRALNTVGSATASQLINVLVLEQTSLSRLLKPLIRDGFIQALSSGVDGREKLLSLTPEGQPLHDRGMKHWTQAQQRLREHLGAPSAAELIALCDRVIAIKQ